VRVSAVATGTIPSLGRSHFGRALQRSSEGGAILSPAPPPCSGVAYHRRVIPSSVEEWARCDPRRLREVRGVFTDIDDTLSTDGVIPIGVVAALAALRAVAVPVIAVTGRPLGWSREIAETTPLSAIAAEDGAVALIPDANAVGGVRVEYADSEAVRAVYAPRLRAAEARIVREVPGAMVSRDSVGRVTDIAIDHSEFSYLDTAQIERVVALMREEGLHATVSSIHINGWFGAHSKLSGATWLLRRLFGRDLDAERAEWLYVGDSSNDELMFASFPLSVGVANLVAFADRLKQWPAYITKLERGRGFVEVAEALLAARGR